MMPELTAEEQRLSEDVARAKNWKRWGPYLSERQWGTVREDYSSDGDVWTYFPHDQARSRAYRWGEDGLLGLCDREGRLCFALALWNGQDPILKERLFGLSGPEGNHGEDVKECYYFLDGTPTHSYMRALYKYPQRAFPYAQLVEENARRGRLDPEFELADTGIFDGDRYFDVTVEYAKAGPDDILIRVSVANHGPDEATLHALPTLWFPNTWAWGRDGEGYWPKGRIERDGEAALLATHPDPGLGEVRLAAGPGEDGGPPAFLFTDNETNAARLFGSPNSGPYVKDAFHAYLVDGRRDAVNPAGRGTKAAAHYQLQVAPGATVTLRLRLSCHDASTPRPFDDAFDATFARRIQEAEEFYAARLPAEFSAGERRVARAAYAGLLWSKQFYHYGVADWLDGDPVGPPPPEGHRQGRNQDWRHLYNRDVISMPDSWEYPWYAAWDLSFHMIPFAGIDPDFAKEQLVLFLREWYMHPQGQLPAYEFAFSDVNPPVHAWACWRVYKMTGARGERDRLFLARTFQKMLLTFTYWVNRRDVAGKNVFAGGFLGLDNIGVFDRSQSLPAGGYLEQADGTAWMAFFCATMLSIALELACADPSYEDIASKFFEHFVAIADATNTLGGSGLWDEQDGFYYDHMALPDGTTLPLRVRSVVGLLPLIAADLIEDEVIDRLPNFKRRMEWFLRNRPDLGPQISYMETRGEAGHARRLLAIPSRERLLRVLGYMLDEDEFLSPHGIRSVSRYHKDHPYELNIGGQTYGVDYEPGESTTGLFGGNSNWRGPVWFPLNYLFVEALERYHHFYGDTLRVECPRGSGTMLTLQEVADELRRRLAGIFLPDGLGARPWQGGDPRLAYDPYWRDLPLFHEYFHGDTGKGLGASHQTGWTALVTRCLGAGPCQPA